MESYIVIKSLSKDTLVIKVNDLIDNGYKPQGGVSVHHTNINIYYYQAMYKESTNG